MQTTLILLKPDCVSSKYCGDVINRFEKAGFRICGIKMIHLSKEILKEHYAHVADKPFYPEIEQFMQSSPVVALALAGPQIIDTVREMLGPTDSTQAAKGTIRGDLGKTKMINVVHASDSEASAAIELKRFFKPDELFTY
ncbi:MAG: nucleoside-diphosphate kinase [Blastochloris sp.]|jgi:nucleoside-diphosphate kinase|nr:nucleoside-diphosphate kinase [Blastochloris sp.]